jgi:hypothetical protein
MNICVNYLSWEDKISFPLKMTVVNSFNVWIVHFPEIVAFVVYCCATLTFCVIFIWSNWKSSGIEKPNSVKFIWNFMLFVKCMFLHQHAIQNMHSVTHNVSNLTCFGTEFASSGKHYNKVIQGESFSTRPKKIRISQRLFIIQFNIL